MHTNTKVGFYAPKQFLWSRTQTCILALRATLTQDSFKHDVFDRLFNAVQQVVQLCSRLFNPDGHGSPSDDGCMALATKALPQYTQAVQH